MRRALFAVAVLAGCEKVDTKYCAMNPRDFEHCPAVDSGPVGPDATLACFGPAGTMFEACLPMIPAMPQILPVLIDTDADGHCLDAAHMPAGWTGDSMRDACFFTASTITSASGPTAVMGSRPLVLLASDTITLSQPLDVASHRGGAPGPGADSPLCTGGTSGNNLGGADAGGGGGTFQTPGGAGGTSTDGTNFAAGGMPSNVGASTLLRGGCPGTLGGGNAGGGQVGDGGGAVYLVAGNAITITTVINASGASGTGPVVSTSPGAGGGSGGMIALFAPVITADSATLFANGGAGAGGGDNGNAIGGSGTDSSNWNAVSTGGGGSGGGGRGYTVGSPALAGQAGPGGRDGGGGGGGAGFIVSNNAVGTSVSPPIRNF